MSMFRVRAALLDAMAARGLSQRALARQAEVAPSSVREILKAERRYSRTRGQSLDDPRVRRTLTKLARPLGLNLATLLPQRDPATLGQALQAARLARGQSQELVAGVVGLTQPTLYRIESQPDYYSTPELLDALARYLDVPATREVDAAVYETAAAPCAHCGTRNDPTRIWCGRCGLAVPLLPRKDTSPDDDDN